MLRITSLLPLVALILAGCSTGYQQSGFAGGFSETQLAPDVFRVHYNGNGFTGGAQANDFALLRAAELTLQSGFTHFQVLGSADASTSYTHTTPGVATTNATVTGYGQNATIRATTVNSGGTTHQVNKPGVVITIRCLRANQASGSAFDAAFLQRSLRTKYRLPQ